MKTAWVVASVFSILTLFLAAAENKYGKKANEGLPYQKSGRMFRANKVNLVWEKAKKNLGDGQLKELFEDLRIQDRLEMDLKRMRTEGMDEDGEYEDHVRMKMLDIMSRYGLDDRWLDGSNRVPEDDFHRRDDDWKPKRPDHKAIWEDKLERLRRKARDAGFDSYGLDQLDMELEHHRRKMDEYHQLRNEIDEMASVSDNAVEAQRRKEKRTDALNELKNKNRDLKDNFQYLQDYVDQGSLGKFEFTEPRVIQLWLLAKKANFSDVELESLKGELRHFETKVRKHEHFRSELDRSEEKRKLKRKQQNHDANHEDLKKRTDDLARRVKKYESEIRHRIMSNMEHTEL